MTTAKKVKIPEITVSYKDQVKNSERQCLRSSFDAYDILKPFYKDCLNHHEEFYVMYLNHGNKLLGVMFHSKGGVTSTIIDIKVILQVALKVHASAIILSHNHPSGGARPSIEDEQQTFKIKEACKLIDVKLFDHLILYDQTFYSMADNGLIAV